MTLHMNRRLEVLAKEIAAKKASPFDSTALNDWFRTNKSVKLPNGTSTFITEADCRQIKGAAQASNSAEKAGTTRPSPVAAPPSILRDLAGVEAAPTFAIRQHTPSKPTEQATPARTIEDVLSDPTDIEINAVLKLRGGCGCGHPNACPPCGNCETPWTHDEVAEVLELIASSEPSPPTPVEVEWIPHKPGDPCPIPGVRSFVARFDRKFNGTTDEVRRHSLALDYWSAQGFGRKVVAYKLLPC